MGFSRLPDTRLPETNLSLSPLCSADRGPVPSGVTDRFAQARVCVWIAAAGARRHGQLFDELGEKLAALGVVAPFLCLIECHFECPDIENDPYRDFWFELTGEYITGFSSVLN